MNDQATSDQALRQALALFDAWPDYAPAHREAELERLQRELPLVHRHLLGLLQADADAASVQFLGGNAMADAVAAGPDVQTADEVPSLHGGRFGPWTLERLLGSGGMGQVWLARRDDGLYQGKVAIKMLHHAAAGASNERFAREGHILARLTHPNIAHLLDAGLTPGGERYLVLQYVEGERIDHYCDGHRLDVASRLRLFRQVCAAVAHAHVNLIVHRDLKPSNILVDHEDNVKLLDFGVAKLLENDADDGGELTRAAGAALTPEYAAPEQVQGGPITTATDVHALGAVLYGLLSGRKPYAVATANPLQWARAIAETTPKRLSAQMNDEATAPGPREVAAHRASTPEKLRRTLAGDLDNIVAKALKKDPAERYPSAQALSDDVTRYLNHEPVAARPDTLVYRSQKFVRRHWIGVAASLMLMTSIAVGVAGVLWQAKVARNEARTAEAVQAFLADIFGANSKEQKDPVKARATTARELLDVGTRKIDSTLDDAPEAKLRVLSTLAGMYAELGINDQAVELLKKRTALAKQVRGAQDATVAQSLVDLADMLKQSKSRDELGGVLSEAEAILDANGDHRSETRAKLLRQLASYHDQRDATRAMAYATEAVAVSRQFLTPALLAQALAMQGNMHSARAEYGQAEAAFLEALALANALPEKPRAELIKIHAYLGSAQGRLGKFPEAEENYRLAAQIAQSLGPDHVDAIVTGQMLGDFLLRTSRLREALDLLQTVRDQAIRARGPTDTFTTWAMRALADAQIAIGQPEAAARELVQAVANTRQRSSDRANLALVLAKQAVAATSLGHYREAQEMLDEAAGLRATLPGGYPETLNDHILAQAGLHVVMQRGDDALRELKRLPIDAFPPGRPSRGWSEGTLARAQAELARGNAPAAEALAVDLAAQIAQSASRPYLQTYEAGAALTAGKARLLQHRPVEASAVLQQALAMSQALYDPTSPQLADAEIALVQSLLDLDRRDQAGALLTQASAIHASHPELGEHYREPLRDAQARAAPPPDRTTRRPSVSP